MTKYVSKTKDMMEWFLVIRVNYKKTVIYLEKLFCQTYYFTFFSSQNNFFCQATTVLF